MDLKIYHNALLGSEPSPIQVALYDAYENGYRGYLAETFDDEKLIASLVIALAQTSPDDGTIKGLKQVALLTPKDLSEGVLLGIRKMAWRIMVRCKSYDFGRAVFKQAFKNILLGHEIPAGHPPRFVAYGYKPGDDIPGWLKSCLWKIEEPPKPLYMMLDEENDIT